MKAVLIASAAAGLLVVASCTPTTPTAPTPAPAAAQRIGTMSVDLGTRPFDFGSQGQARELVTLIESSPGKALYEIRYATTADTVTVSGDLAQNILRRVHRTPDGHGSNEEWRGYVMERLRTGATGGSMNDTPAGKSLVVRTDF